MNNIKWHSAGKNNIGHQEYLYANGILVAYVGQYCDDNNFQVSLKGNLNSIFKTSQNFKTLNACKKYVEHEFEKWIQSLTT